LSKDERDSRVGRQPSPLMLRQAQHERLKWQARLPVYFCLTTEK
jgi:hypothetical protein